MFQIPFKRALFFSTMLFTLPVHATEISFVNTFANISNEQTSNGGGSLSLNGTFFSLTLNSTVANAYTSASVTYPGPASPQALTNSVSSPSSYSFQTGLLPNLATLETDYPFGTYSFAGTNGGGTDTATLSYAANDFPQSNPFLTGSDFSNLQGMNSAVAFTAHFSPFVTGSNATDSFIFFTLFDDTTNAFVTLSGNSFLPATTTSYAIPAGTLIPGHTYTYELDYSNRDIEGSTMGAVSAPQLGFDVRTDGVFTTSAVPEPATGWFIAVALGGLLIRRCRSRNI